MKFILLIIFFILANISFCQNIDSLKNELKKTTNDTLKCYILNELIDAENDDNVWTIYNDELLKISKKGLATVSKKSPVYKIYLKYLAAALNNIGYLHNLNGNDALAIDFYLKSLKIEEEIDNKIGVAYSLNNIGVIYKTNGNFEKALFYFKKSLKIRQELNDQLAIANSYNNIGTLYNSKGNNIKALEYFMKSLKINQEKNNKSGIGNNLSNIGFIYRNLGEYQKAYEYYKKSLIIKKEVNDLMGLAISMNYIAEILYFQEKYLEALKYSIKSMKLANFIGFPQKIKNAANIQKKIYKKLGNYKLAYEMYELEIFMRDSIEKEENEKELMQKELQYNFDKKLATDSISNAKEKEIRDVEIAKQKAEIRATKNQQYALFGGIFLLFGFIGFIINRYRKIRIQNEIIENQKHLVEEKNREILDSIIYAKRIQSAILPQPKIVKQFLVDSFIFYKPKDIVAGDFYWLEVVGDTVLFAAADCTGHGVPGAMVSVVCNNALNRSVREFDLSYPNEILEKTREIVLEEFEKSDENVKDGMDISLCAIDTKKNILRWSGAHNPLWLLRNKEIIETKADKQPIGKFSHSKPFSLKEIHLEKNDIIYIFTDGFQDQFGGPESYRGGKKYRPSKMRELFLSICEKTMEEQKIIIEKSFEDWKGDLEQVDDVCVIGVRV
ncbi:MAG: tetratricopeptide repeat protein [Flavobacteriia bacterium]|nr:tetratricopeptide repeat protein [Flavobacteriia bacterium]